MLLSQRDFKHLQERIREFNGTVVTLEEFMAQFRQKISATNIDNVKQDVIPFIDPSQLKTLDIWSTDYFLHMVNLMKVQ